MNTTTLKSSCKPRKALQHIRCNTRSDYTQRLHVAQHYTFIVGPVMRSSSSSIGVLSASMSACSSTSTLKSAARAMALCTNASSSQHFVYPIFRNPAVWSSLPRVSYPCNARLTSNKTIVRVCPVRPRSRPTTCQTMFWPVRPTRH
jgi:hypothetical protein